MSASGEATLRGRVSGAHRLLQLTIAALVAVVLVGAGLAQAAWLSSGAGAGAGKALTSGAGNTPSASVSGRTVTLTWAASTYSNGSPITTYLVKRYDSAGSVLQSITSGSCASLVTGTSCAETAVPAGTWRWTVTPANGNWRGAEGGQVVASVSAATLALTPTTTRTAATLSGSIANYVTGETLTFRLDSTSGTVLTGTLGGVATPTAVGASGGGAVTVTLPGGVSTGAHTVYAVAAPSGDNAAQVVTVDNTAPPVPSITAGPSGTTTATTASFSFTDTEAGVTFQCALDGAPATTCTSPKAYTGLADGSHTFAVTATDAVGNVSAAATRTWTVDTGGPANTITFPVNGNAYTSAGYTAGCSTAATGDLCGVTSDPGTGVATVRISLFRSGVNRYWNGTSFTSFAEVQLTPTGTTSWSYNIGSGSLPDGTYTLRVYATDGVPNTTTTTSTFTVDNVLPNATVTAPANGGSYGAATYDALCSTPTTGDVCGTASDASSGIDTVTVSVLQASSGRYWNGTSFTSATEVQNAVTGTTSWSYALDDTAYTNGSYTLKVTVTDDAGNVRTASSTYTVDMSTPAPVITPTAPTGSSKASFAFSSTEAGVTFTCSIDGGPTSACTSPKAYQPLANASHTFAVTATDAAGNTSTSTYTWTIAAPTPGGGITFPVDGGSYTINSFVAGCGNGNVDVCGTASMTGGVASVQVSIQQVSTGLYFSGTGFSNAAETLLTATGTTSWAYTINTGSAADGDYAFRYYVTNLAGTVSAAGATSTMTLDTVSPTAQAPKSTNGGGTQSRIQQNDTLVLTTSERLLPSSILGPWDGSTTSVVVRLTNGGGGNDTLTVYNAANNAQLPLGTIDLGRTDYTTGTAYTFGATGTKSTMTQSGSTITIVLGTASATAPTAGGAGNMRWTPSATATDLAGNAMSTTSAVETDNDRDF